MENNLNKLFELIGINFKDELIIKEALTHRSFLNEAKTKNLKNNERMEFLGDAVLEMIVTVFLLNKFSEFPEGELTSLRASLVRTESLADEAKRLELGNFIFMSKGEESTGGRNRPYILANAFEALIGAIYLDQGYNIVQDFIIKNVCYKIDNIVESEGYIDSKSKLQEISQETLKITPTYKLLGSSGPDHNKTFDMGVYVGEDLYGKGQGKSKQEAEQNAASNALKLWNQQKHK